jgi:ATP-dependent helicase HrpA
MTDIRNQLKALLPPGFIATTPFTRMRELPRYVKAMAMRLDKFSINPVKDAQWQQEMQGWWQAWQGRMAADAQRGVFDPRIDEFRWMLEELRVSLWAQQLKTPYPISFKRLARYWEQATAPRSSAGNR